MYLEDKGVEQLSVQVFRDLAQRRSKLDMFTDLVITAEAKVEDRTEG